MPTEKLTSKELTKDSSPNFCFASLLRVDVGWERGRVSREFYPGFLGALEPCVVQEIPVLPDALRLTKLTLSV